MDAFVIKFMTASFYYFLRLAYKTQEGKVERPKPASLSKESIRESILASL